MSRGTSEPARAIAVDVDRTVSAGFAQMWVMFGVLHGLDSDELCSSCGFRAADIADRDRQIPRSWYVALRNVIIGRLPNIDVGIELAAFANPASLGYLGMAFQRASTPLEGMRLITRFAVVMDSDAAARAPRAEIDGDAVHWIIPRSADDPPEAVEAILIGCTELLRRLTGSPLRPRSVHFSAHREALAEKLCRIFGAPVEFGAKNERVVYSREDVERPLLDANPAGVRHCEAALEKLRSRLDEPLVTAVSRAIEADLATGNLTQSETARRLGMSLRSLQRKLKERGMNYQSLVDQARHTVAVRCLSGRASAVTEAAYATGYESVSSFNRAFRRWTGSSPRAYKRRSNT